MSQKIEKCPGCQRREMHKRCPAHGTIFYMSGEWYSNQVEDLGKVVEAIDYDIYKELFVNPEDKEDAFFEIEKLREIVYGPKQTQT